MGNRRRTPGNSYTGDLPLNSPLWDAVVPEAEKINRVMELDTPPGLHSKTLFSPSFKIPIGSKYTQLAQAAAKWIDEHTPDLNIPLMMVPTPRGHPGGVTMGDVIPDAQTLVNFMPFIGQPDDPQGRYSMFDMFSLFPTAKIAKHSVIPPVAGRVIKNIRRPQNYDLRTFGRDLGVKSVKDIPQAITKSLKAIIANKPVYTLEDPLFAAREVPYSMIWGLKPQHSMDAYIKNVDGSLGFNPENIIGRMLLKEIAEGKSPLYKGYYQSVLGGYKRKVDKAGNIHWSDDWDFGLNKGEFRKYKAGMYDKYRQVKYLWRDLKLNKKGSPHYNHTKKALESKLADMVDNTISVGLRAGVNKIIKPVTIKGTILKDDIDALIKTPLYRPPFGKR